MTVKQRLLISTQGLSCVFLTGKSIYLELKKDAENIATCINLFDNLVLPPNHSLS